MQKLGIILHTNNPEEYFAVAGPSITWLRPMLKKVQVHFLFNFQPPWTKKELTMEGVRLVNMGFGMDYVFSRPRERPVSTYKLRHDAAALLPDADWWMYCDDNLQFQKDGTACYPGGSAERYLQVIEYFNSFANCGVVMCEGSLGGAHAKYQIRPTLNGLIATSRGLFYRNTTGGKLHPGKEYKILGGMGETAPAFRLMSEGFFIAKQFNNPTRHLHKHHFRDELPKDHVTNYHKVIKPNAERYIRELYGDPDWTHELRYLPRKVKEMYKAAGGDMTIYQRPNSYWKDYHVE